LLGRQLSELIGCQIGVQKRQSPLVAGLDVKRLRCYGAAMILVSIAVFLLVRRWWLGTLIAALVGAAWSVPAVWHMTGDQHATAWAMLAMGAAMPAGVAAVMYGLRYLLTAAWQAIRGAGTQTPHPPASPQ
jgi:hypothetical protein